MKAHKIFALLLCGNFIEVVTLINSAPNVIKEEKIDFRNVRPLHLAVNKGQYYICKRLLDLGADVNIKDDTGRSPLHYAAERGSAEIASLLIEYGAKIDCVTNHGSSPCHLAAVNGFKNVLEVLLHHNDDLVNIKDTIGDTPLHRACKSGDMETVAFILQKKPAIAYNNYGSSALHTAAQWNQDKIVELMVKEFGWDMDIRNTKTGKTPLMSASQVGQVITIQKLIELGADIDTFDDNYNCPALYFQSR